MGAFSDYVEEKILDRILNAESDTEWPVISDVFVALYKTVLDDAGAGGAEVVSTATSYARKKVTTGFTVGSTGHAENTADITFASATGDWGTIVGFAIWDTGTKGAGNLLFHGTLTSSRVINSGGTAKFLAGELEIDLD